ncbi:hypothetical protein [Clostridium grantii]|uniref:Coenzyme PQQ synthesis protein D (PqqD) n=1 Tax=Clostridium grantii DSM 8605 TaxID=1121316 RepID=A0A1M5VFW6_9CLOT|nr:hypothetical protein [Clostridium grantii]SHH74065.1 hypothetical protein SAMN02745207_02277 [Clostridium grantii DSM 8605]
MIKMLNNMDFKPCRVTECFSDENGIIEVLTEKGPIRLKNAGRILWNMSTAEYTINEIVEEVVKKLQYTNKEEVYKACIKLLLALNQKELMILNWNPLYKRRSPQYGI